MQRSPMRRCDRECEACRLAQLRGVVAAVSILSLIFGSAAALSQEIAISRPQRAHPVSFQDEVLPILRKNCLACHNQTERQGDLVLETAEELLQGGDTGPAVVPGKASESLLISLASHRDDPVMPPDGNDVAAANLTPSELGLLALWIDQGAASGTTASTLSPKSWAALPPGFHPTHAVTLSPDGAFVACCRANQIHLYHIPTGQQVAQLSDPLLAQLGLGDGVAHADAIQSLVFNDRGDMLASGSFREVKIWKKPRDVHRVALQHTSPLTACCIDATGSTIAIGDDQGVIRLIDVTTGLEAARLNGHSAAVSELAFHGSSGILLSSSTDGTLRFWSTSTARELAKIETTQPVSSVSWVPKDPATVDSSESAVATDTSGAVKLESLRENWWIASGGGDNDLRVWSVPSTATEPDVLEIRPAAVSRAVRSGRWLAFLTDTGEVQVVDWEARKVIGTWTTSSSLPTALALRASQDASTPPLVWICSEQGIVSGHDPTSGAIVTQWQASQVPLRSLDVSADSAWLVTGDAEGRTVLWDLSLREELGVPATPTTPIHAVSSTSRDRRFVAAVAGSDRQSVLLIALDASAPMRALPRSDTAIAAVCISHDAARVAIAADDGRLWIAPTDGSAPWEEIGAQPGPLQSVSFDHTGTRIFAAGKDVQAWNLETKESTPLPPPDSSVVKLDVALDGNPFAITAQGRIRVWNAADGSPLRDIGGGGETVGWGLIGDGSVLALAIKDQPLRFWRLADGGLDREFPNALPARSIASSTDRSQLVIVGFDGRVSWLDPTTGRAVETETLGECRSIAFGSDGSLRGITADGTQHHLTLRYVRDLFDDNGEVVDVRCSQVAATAYTAASDGSLRGFALPQGNALFGTNHGAGIVSLAVSPDGQRLATAGANSTVRFWTSNGGGQGVQQITGLAEPVSEVCFQGSTSEAVACLFPGQNRIDLFDVQDGKLLERWTPAAEEWRSGLLCENSVLALSAHGIRQWTPNFVRRLTGHSQPIAAIAVLPDQQRQIISASHDGSARRWNLDNGQQMAAYNHGGRVTGLAVRSDGQRIATSSDNGTARIWNINGQQLAQISGSLTRTAEVQRATQRRTSAENRVSRAKQLLEAAEKDLPEKTTADMAASETLTAANAKVREQEDAVNAARKMKDEMEAEALRMATVAQEAFAQQTVAESVLAAANRQVQAAQQRVNQIAAVANVTPGNTQLQQRLEQTQARLTQLQSEVQSLTQALEAPRARATETTTQANAAAGKATEAQKPYNDALDALKAAQTEQNLASQQQAVAAIERKRAAELPALRQQAVTESEARVVAAQSAFDAARQAADAAVTPIECVRFAPDGSTLLTGGTFTDLQTWDSDTGSPIAAFSGHSLPISDAVFINDGELLSISADGTARIWNARPSWQLEHTIGASTDPSVLVDRVTALDFDADSGRLAAGTGVPSRSGDVVIIDVTSGNVASRINAAHEDVVYSVMFSPDGQTLASAGADRYLRTHSLADGNLLRRFEGHTNHVLGVAWQNDGSVLASAGADATVKVWDAETGDQARTITNFAKHVTGIAFIGDTTNVATSCGDRRVQIHNTSNGGTIRTFPTGTSWLHAIAVTPDGAVVASGGADGSISVWNGTNGQQIAVFALPSASEQPSRPDG